MMKMHLSRENYYLALSRANQKNIVPEAVAIVNQRCLMAHEAEKPGHLKFSFLGPPLARGCKRRLQGGRWGLASCGCEQSKILPVICKPPPPHLNFFWFHVLVPVWVLNNYSEFDCLSSLFSRLYPCHHL